MEITNLLIAPDSFKNCLPAEQVAFYLSQGIKRQITPQNIDLFPIADGGEGFCRYLTKIRNGKVYKFPTKDPLMRDIEAEYGVLSPDTAVMDIASASGMELLTPTEQNPLLTSSYGSGLLLKHIIESGYKNILIGLGGSATNDGGIGMASALGFRFLDEKGKDIEWNGRGLGNLAKIDNSSVFKKLRHCKIELACDVSNPLLGKSGAALVYAEQKGANKSETMLLEKNLSILNRKILSTYGTDYQNVKGTGAAGGIGLGMLAFFQAKLHSGIQLFLQESGLLANISNYDFIISGEGEINQQTYSGKALSGIAKLASKHTIPLIAVTGKSHVKNNYFRTYELENFASSKMESIKNAPFLLEKIGEEIGAFIKNYYEEKS